MFSPSIPSRLVGFRAKIKRAEEHIRDLESAMLAFRNTNPYGFRIEDDSQTGDKLHRIEIRSQTPLQLSLIAGDAVHNLRSAFDHLAWQLVEANGQTPGKWTYFPIYDTSSKYKTESPAKVKGMNSGAISLIEAVQPYQSGYDSLGALNELDNFDKHRLLFVTAFALSAVMPTWKVKIGPWQQFQINAPVGIQPDGTLPILQDGHEVGRMKAPIDEDAYFDLSFEIAFREPAIVKGKAVIPFLSQLSQLSDRIVIQFDLFL